MPGINVIFDGPPGPEGGRFVEIENDRGESIRVGEWEADPRPEHEGLWRLRIPATALKLALLEIDDFAGAWYLRVLDEDVHRTTEHHEPVNIDWTRDGRMVGVEVLGDGRKV